MCLATTSATLDILSKTLNTPFLKVISNTTQALLQSVQTLKRNKTECTELMEQACDLLNTIIVVHLESDTCGELPPSVLADIAKFAGTLQTIYTFVQAQQGSKVKLFLRQNEMSTLLKECKAGIDQAFESFQIQSVKSLTHLQDMEESLAKRHQEVLAMIDPTSSDGASSISRPYSGSYTSSNSFSMLPSEPKIFHGRESELMEILRLFQRVTPRIAILGAGGMGKTCLARSVLHHAEICARYNEHRYFVACDSATTRLELVALIASHLGLKPGKGLTQRVISYFLDSAPRSLLILDNLESAWEPAESRRQVEELLSLLTEKNHLALIITMRGAERPEKVMWTRPFLPPLQPLAQSAAREVFFAITDNIYNLEDVDSVLSLTNNMPLAIVLLAHLVDSEGCSRVLSRWEEEKTALVSAGYDKRDNLGLSISLSLSSPRVMACPDSQHLLSLLSILPDGLSDAELKQSKLLVHDVLGCKTALLRTALAYRDEQKRLKVLVPIREYIHRFQPPTHDHVRPLLKYFTELLQLRIQYSG
ncbi:P-loop containing nucleoside triphosphate hydrolase protein, partial [Mycena alexandri]